jgi:hypothetical protein
LNDSTTSLKHKIARHQKFNIENPLQLQVHTADPNKRAAKKADRILPSRNYSSVHLNCIKPTPFHRTDHPHNEVVITSPGLPGQCLPRPNVNGTRAPISLPRLPRDPEPPTTKARPSHSSAAISLVLDNERNGQEKEWWFDH